MVAGGVWWLWLTVVGGCELWLLWFMVVVVYGGCVNGGCLWVVGCMFWR